MAALKRGLQNAFSSESFAADVLDFEVCGSYAFGCALPHSDVDICVSSSTEAGQRRIFNAIRGGAWARLKPRLDELGNSMRLRLDVGYNNHDNKLYNVGLSMATGLLFGRPPGRYFQESRRWDEAQWKWVFKAKRPRQHNLAGPRLEVFNAE